MGEFGFNLLMTVEIQVGILQHFVLTTVMTEETPDYSYCTSKGHFCNQAFTMVDFLQTRAAFQWEGLG